MGDISVGTLDEGGGRFHCKNFAPLELRHYEAAATWICPSIIMRSFWPFPMGDLPQWCLPMVLALLILLPEGNDSKTSRVRTNYKLRVGEQPIGRYTEYSQVRIPPTGKYRSDEASKFYRHPKGQESQRPHILTMSMS